MLDRPRAAKLRALVGLHWAKDAIPAGDPQPFTGGAAWAGSGPGGARGWVLIDDGRPRRFGAALAWAWRHRVTELHVLVDEAVPGGAGVVARRAAEMSAPPAVWVVAGRDVRRAEPAGDEPDTPLDEAEERLADLLRAHGAEPVVEHGVLRGEVLGLEVARVIAGRLQVGVGRHDRVARAGMRPGEDPAGALDETVAAVRALRRPGAPMHPANTLARARWLRAVLCARPELAGAARLEPVAPPLPWFDLPDSGAAPARGLAEDGAEVVVVCSTGLDLDLVPTAADSRRLRAPGARLAILVPDGDDHRVTRHLAAGLARPAGVLTVRRGWEALLDY